MSLDDDNWTIFQNSNEFKDFEKFLFYFDTFINVEFNNELTSLYLLELSPSFLRAWSWRRRDLLHQDWKFGLAQHPGSPEIPEDQVDHPHWRVPDDGHCQHRRTVLPAGCQRTDWGILTKTKQFYGKKRITSSTINCYSFFLWGPRFGLLRFCERKHFTW